MRFLLTVLCAALSSASVLIGKEALPGVPEGWRISRHTEVNKNIDLIFFVKQQNMDVLEKQLLRASNPSSPYYGQHLTFDEVNRISAPLASSVEAVENWIRSINANVSIESSPNSDILRVKIPVAQAETLLNTKFYDFTSETGHKLTRTLQYSVPEEVAGALDFVGGTVQFPAFVGKVSSGNGLGVDPKITPDYLKNLYELGGYRSTNANNSQCATGYLAQYISLTDLSNFFSTYDAKSVKNVPTIVGPNTQTNPGDEASLDIQYIMSLGADVPTTFWSTADETDPFYTFLLALAKDSAAPWVISTSYGQNENTLTAVSAERVNNEFIKSGARGISHIWSSGDSGAGSATVIRCKRFGPVFPATSPYITSVGATQTPNGNAESGATFSSGGFSEIFPQQSWQATAVNNFLKTSKQLPASTLYNAAGRGFPDVSAHGVNFEIVIKGRTEGVSGTSASAPAFSGIVALLNDIRFNSGKSSLGFLNPFLYQNAAAFNDITSGNAPGCSTTGFYAAAGWDPVTGLGTPNFPKLTTAVKNLA